MTNFISIIAALSTLFSAIAAYLSYKSYRRFAMANIEIQITIMIISERNTYANVLKNPGVDKNSTLFLASVEQLLSAYEYATNFFFQNKVDSEWFKETFSNEIKSYLTNDSIFKKVFNEHKTQYRSLNKFYNETILAVNL